jgi:hypothetical protein
MPDFQLVRFVPSTGTPTTLGTGSDGSGTVGDYEDPHYIELTGLSHTVQSNAQYYLLFGGEADTNAIAGLELDSVEASWD